jgi:hypothetical protein
VPLPQALRRQGQGGTTPEDHDATSTRGYATPNRLALAVAARPDGAGTTNREAATGRAGGTPKRGRGRNPRSGVQHTQGS